MAIREPTFHFTTHFNHHPLVGGLPSCLVVDGDFFDRFIPGLFNRYSTDNHQTPLEFFSTHRPAQITGKTLDTQKGYRTDHQTHYWTDFFSRRHHNAGVAWSGAAVNNNWAVISILPWKTTFYSGHRKPTAHLENPEPHQVKI